MMTQWQKLIDALGPELLQFGDVGFTVQTLQSALKALSLYSRAVDGYFGPHTERALLQLQRDYGLTQTGQFDLSTWYALSFWVKPQYLKTQPQTPEKSMHLLELHAPVKL
jgi:peptidoglycan hydrolase-like protein with peptidoglycan-binding domain